MPDVFRLMAFALANVTLIAGAIALLRHASGNPVYPILNSRVRANARGGFVR